MPHDHMVNEGNTSPTPNNNRGTPINSGIQIIQIIVDPVSYKITTHKNTIFSASSYTKRRRVKWKILLIDEKHSRTSATTPWPTYSIEQCVYPDATYTGQKSANTILHIPKCSAHIAHTYFGRTIQNIMMSNICNTCSPASSHAVRCGVEAAQDLSAWENIILHSHYTMEYRRRRLNDRTDRQDHDSDNFDGNDSFQDNDNDNSHLNGNDNFDDKDNGNAHLNDNANFDDNDNFDGNDVDDNDNLDSNDSIVTESEQEYFLNFSSNVQRNQDGGAAGPPVSK